MGKALTDKYILLHLSGLYWDRVVVFSATFNNISVLSRLSVLLVEETRVPRENHRPATVTDKLYHITFYQVRLAISRIWTHKVYISAKNTWFK